MRRRAAQVAVALAAAGFALLSYLYLTLPDVRPLARTNPVSTAFIELRLNEARVAGRSPRRVQRWMRYEAFSNNLRRAVLVAEDDAFWQHDGVDVEQLRKSIESNLEKRKMARGGSTITQQLAKNLYLSPSRNPIRKLREFLIARRLEAALSKRRILEIYLNVIEWGDGVYGADAAARRYFGKSASALSAEEAALMAGAIINPRVHNPAHPTARLRVRQQIILKRLGWVEPPPEAPEIPEPASPTIVPEELVPITPLHQEPLPEPLPSPPQEEPPLSNLNLSSHGRLPLPVRRHHLTADRRSSIVSARTKTVSCFDKTHARSLRGTERALAWKLLMVSRQSNIRPVS